MGLKANAITSDTAAEVALELTKLVMDKQLYFRAGGNQSKDVYPKSAKDLAEVYAAMFETVVSGDAVAPESQVEKK